MSLNWEQISKLAEVEGRMSRVEWKYLERQKWGKNEMAGTLP